MSIPNVEKYFVSMNIMFEKLFEVLLREKCRMSVICRALQYNEKGKCLL